MNEVNVSSTNQLIDPSNAGDRLGLVVSQQPTLFFDSTATLQPFSDPDQGFISAYVRVSQNWMSQVWEFQMEAQRAQSRWSDAVVQLSSHVGLIQQKLDGLTTAMDRLAKQRTFVVPISTLAPEPLQLRLNIPATIEGDGEDFTATFSEANISASGETEADAIANLKESLVSTFEFLESLSDSERGPLPARQWEILRSVLTR